MTDRYIIEFKEGGVDTMEAVLTGGIAVAVEKGLDAITGDDNHGWYCTITDTITKLHDTQWGVSKSEAQEKTFITLKSKIDSYSYNQEKENKRHAEQRIQIEKDEYLRKTTSSSSTSTSYDDNDNSESNCLGTLIGYGLAAAAILWFAFAVALPLILINIGIIGFIAALMNKAYSKYLYSLAILGGIVIVLDYNYGWSTKTLVENVSFFKSFIQAFYYMNLTAGLLGAYFLIRNFLNEKKPEISTKNEFTKRNLIIMGSLLSVGIITIALQKFVDSGKSLNFNFMPKEKSSLTNNSSNKGKILNDEVTSDLNSNSLNESIKSQSQKLQPLSNAKLNNVPNEILSDDKMDSKIQDDSNSNSQNIESNRVISNHSEKRSVENIKSLFNEENSRDMTKFLSHFSNNIERYWDITNPSQSKIAKTVGSRWQRHINSSNNIIKIKAIDQTTYEMSNEYSYTERKTGLSKKVFSTITIRIDDKGKIYFIKGLQHK